MTESHVYEPAKLLVCFVPRRRGDLLVRVAKAAGARGGTVAMGRAQGRNRVLAALSLADIEHDITFTVMGREAGDVVAAVLKAAAAEPRKLRGVAFLLDVSGMLFRVPGPGLGQSAGGGERMSSGYKLITVIVNQGYADDVMAQARAAGAKGGTIITARGTGTEEDVKFFGISLVPEKDMLLIVAETEAMPAILEAIRKVPSIQRPGGGVVFHMDVEGFMPLGQPAK